MTAVSLCHFILKSAIKSEWFISDLVGKTGTKSVDVMEVCEVIYWMLIIQAHSGYGNVSEGKWGANFLPKDVVQLALKTASEKAAQLGICQNRVQNFKSACENQEIDLYAFMEIAQRYPFLKHQDHESCTPEVCQFSNLDTTTVKQAHKCSTPHVCKKTKFPVSVIETSLNNGGDTTWSLSGKSTVTLGQPFIAISHVWLDGTGVGVEKLGAGIVNDCLWSYFADIACELGSEGLWWDTISIPSEKEARRKAINSMHHYYADAQYTVIHDEYLLQFEWADDGSPCLALVLSPWFTRGWTALELSMSRKVKVLYKGKTPGKPLIKDLDDDVLAHDPGQVTRAHWIASSQIRRLRKPVENVSDLLTTLHPRSTSRESDKIIIAGLLARLENYDYYKHSLEETTQDILMHLHQISPTSLLHGHETMVGSRGFSWCPRAIYAMPTDPVGDLAAGGFGGNARTLEIDKTGAVSGWWYYRVVTHNDVTEKSFTPRGSPTVVAKVNDTLNEWKNCLFLREGWRSKGPGLLVTTVAKDPDDDITIDCRYVGSVEDNEGCSMADYDGIVGQCIIRLGNEGNRPDTCAKDIVGLLQSSDDDLDSGGNDLDSDVDNGPRMPTPDDLIGTDDLSESSEPDEDGDSWETMSDSEEGDDELEVYSSSDD